MNAQELLGKYDQGKRDFAGITLNECNLTGVSLPEIVLQAASLNVSNLSSANLSRSNLQEAQLNVTRLSGANLSYANLKGSKLNVANLIRVILTQADLTEASLIRAEMVRANLSRAQLVSANLSEADLRESNLKGANLHSASLARADLRSGTLTGANLTQANLSGINAARANFQGANLKEVELRHANLSRTDFSGANLRGANLRWVDLSGANLAQADLTDAKLSGANLTGASLEGAILVNTVLVHADLSHANLMQATWIGSDLSGATLTGIKIFGAVRYSLTFSEETRCEWVDLSPNGDQSRVEQFTLPSQMDQFFNRSPARVQVTVDCSLSPLAHQALATIGYQLSTLSPLFEVPPCVEVGNRKTVLTYTVAQDTLLPALAYGALFPFRMRAEGQQAILTAIAQVQQYLSDEPESPLPRSLLAPLSGALTITAQRLRSLAPIPSEPFLETAPFFQASLQVELVNSSNHRLEIYQSPHFRVQQNMTQVDPEVSETPLMPVSLSELLTFFQRCRFP
ncbi:MAG TPA: pentapeptide repeat-containing protein [Leptolyngbyaceae cyanobacterium]